MPRTKGAIACSTTRSEIGKVAPPIATVVRWTLPTMGALPMPPIAPPTRGSTSPSSPHRRAPSGVTSEA